MKFGIVMWINTNRPNQFLTSSTYITRSADPLAFGTNRAQIIETGTYLEHCMIHTEYRLVYEPRSRFGTRMVASANRRNMITKDEFIQLGAPNIPAGNDYSLKIRDVVTWKSTLSWTYFCSVYWKSKGNVHNGLPTRFISLENTDGVIVKQAVRERKNAKVVNFI